MSTNAHALETDNEPVDVPLRNVVRELDRQLKLTQGPGISPVIRARMSNLVVFCESLERAERISAEVPDIVAAHPARVLLLISDPKGASQDRVSATVHSRVHRVGTGLRAFSEQVTLRADGAGIDHLPFAVRGLLIGDLPTNLWWASPQPPALAGPILYDLSERADQVVYDSFGWPEPARGMSATATWLDKFERGPHEGRYRVASDLTWRRLKDWRRILMQALEPSTAVGSLETVTELSFEHGVHSVMAAWNLASWLTIRLGWRVSGVRVHPGVEIHWMFSSSEGARHVRIKRLAEGPSGIRSLRIAGTAVGSAEPIALVVTPEDDFRRLSITHENLDVAPRTITVQPRPVAELLGRQLSDRERDPVFRQTMAIAQTLAQSVLKG